MALISVQKILYEKKERFDADTKYILVTNIGLRSSVSTAVQRQLTKPIIPLRHQDVWEKGWNFEFINLIDWTI